MVLDQIIQSWLLTNATPILVLDKISDLKIFLTLGELSNLEKPYDNKKMIDRATQVQILLWKEVALKSKSAAIAFIIAAVLLWHYHFNLTYYKALVQASCVVVLLANLLRIWISHKIIMTFQLDGTSKLILKFSIWINALAWSIIFSFAALELNAASFDYSVLICLLAGSAAGSIVTLGYDKSIFLPYQILLFVPMMFILFYQYWIGINPVGHYLCLIFALFLVYQFKQYKGYRSQLMARFNAQIDLEHSYEELKKKQSILVDQTAKLIQASKINALSDMASGLAHEVNNSLMVIMGSTQQVQRELKKNNLLTDSLNKKIMQSTSAIHKIKDVIEGLKYFSLQMGPQPKEVVDLNEIITRTLSYTHELLKAQHIELEVRPIPEVRIFCHSFQITQILFNLTKNAQDSMTEIAGEKWLRYEFAISENHVYIKIINNGRPILPAHHSKLFQPFFSTKDVNQGTGLSLSSSKGIALDHKGDLYFEEREHTTFVLKLPIVKEDPAQRDPRLIT